MQLSSSSIRVETLVDILLILMRDDSLQPGLDNDINLAKIFQIVTAQGNHRANHLLRLVSQDLHVYRRVSVELRKLSWC